MDSTDSAKPRVNGSMLSSRMGQYVSLVGKNLGISSDGLSISIETSDGQRVAARFPQQFHDSLDPFIELVGKVERDCSLSIMRVVNFGTDFDIEAYDEVIRLASNFPDIFSSSGQHNTSNMDM